MSTLDPIFRAHGSKQNTGETGQGTRHCSEDYINLNLTLLRVVVEREEYQRFSTLIAPAILVHFPPSVQQSHLGPFRPADRVELRTS